MLQATHLVGFGAAVAGGATPPLDLISASAAGAFSLRLAKTSYAGNCLKIRRSSDNTTQNIGFSAGLWDSAAALSFCGAGNGFIDTWYDQSGNAKDMLQATAGLQPQIISSGAVISTFDARGALKFDGSDDFLACAAINSFLTVSAYSAFIAGYLTGGGSTQITTSVAAQTNPQIVSTSQNDMGMGVQSSGTGSPAINSWNWAGSFGASSGPATYIASTKQSFMARYDGTNCKAYVDGGTGASSAVGNIGDAITGGSMWIGKGSSAALACHIAEVFLFKSSISAADANLLGASSFGYWGLDAWSNIS